MRRFIATFLSSLALLLLVAPVTLAFDPFSGICNEPAAQTSSLCQGRATDPTKNPLTGSQGLIVGIANVIAITAGLAAVIVIIVGGFRFVTSGGDAAKAKSARETIIGALVGVVIIALADVIISFVISRI